MQATSSTFLTPRMLKEEMAFFKVWSEVFTDPPSLTQHETEIVVYTSTFSVRTFAESERGFPSPEVGQRMGS